MRALPKIVLERLKGRSVGNQQSTIENQPSPHLDSNLVAAFVEKTLTERERSQVLSHLAQCAECREIVASTLPEEVKVSEPTRFPARRRWSAWPTLRSGALAAVLGGVAIVVVLHTRQLRKQEVASHPTGVATKGPLTLMAGARPPADLEAGKNLPEFNARQLPADRKTPSPGAVPTAPLHAKREFKLSAEREGMAGPAKEPESQADMSAATAKAQAIVIPRSANVGAVGGVPEPISALPPPSAGVLMREKAAQSKLPRMAFREEVASAAAQPAARWTISADGKVQRSEDGGKTWEDVHIDDRVTFRVIQAVAQEVWAGGSEGALYHSGDGGATWTRASLSSDGNPSTEAIVAIISSSRNTQYITVRTTSGEQWTSEDGGRHWQRHP